MYPASSWFLDTMTPRGQWHNITLSVQCYKLDHLCSFVTFICQPLVSCDGWKFSSLITFPSTVNLAHVSPDPATAGRKHHSFQHHRCSLRGQRAPGLVEARVHPWKLNQLCQWLWRMTEHSPFRTTLVLLWYVYYKGSTSRITWLFQKKNSSIQGTVYK